MEELNSGPPKTNPSSGREEDLNPGPPDYKSSALTTRPRCLQTISFPLHLPAQTGSLRIHLFQPRYYHPSTTSPRHTNMFCRLSRKNFACCFLVQSRPNTIANQQRIVIWHYEGRWNASCHDLSCLEAGHRPFEDLSVLTKFALVQQVVRTCFCDCLTKCIARATRTNQKTTASLFS